MSATGDKLRDLLNGELHVLRIERDELAKEIAARTEKLEAVEAEIAAAEKLEQHHKNAADGAP